jgi:uncharacterized membrane protein YkvA (DUF1232 family)
MNEYVLRSADSVSCLPTAETVLMPLQNLRQWARGLKRDLIALYLAARDPRVPWPAKLVAACVAAYALSPIDLIPDFIPVLGYLDDLVLVPLGIALAIRLIPPAIWEDLRASAAARTAARPTSRVGAAVIVVIWIALGLAALWAIFLR